MIIMEKEILEKISDEARQAAEELIAAADLKQGNLVVIGCSSSEAGGNKIGSASSLDIAEAIFNGLYPVFNDRGIFIAAQCCEHLNRALIVERELMEKRGYEQVNVIPQPKAGGSFATTAYKNFKDPAAVEEIKADAGIDIGGTLIGMHLKRVAVPVRLSIQKIGEAGIICARTRVKFVGGARAVYDEGLM